MGKFDEKILSISETKRKVQALKRLQENYNLYYSGATVIERAKERDGIVIKGDINSRIITIIENTISLIQI